MNQSLPEPNSFLKTSIDLIDRIENVKIPHNYVMVSLDVSSLFTNLPIHLVLTGIEKRWHHICKFTALSLEEFKDGIKLLMDWTFFQFDKSVYKQTYGIPMGSPIFPTIANIVMQDLEENYLSDFDFTISVYFRYVDGTVILIPNNKIEIVTSVLNSYHERIKFTSEVEKNNSLNFPNISLIRNHDNSIIAK